MAENQVNILIKSFFDDKAFTAASSSLAKIRDATDSIKVPRIADRLNIQEQSGLFRNLTGQAMGFREEMVQNAYLDKFGLGLNTLAKAADNGSSQFQALQQDLRGGGWEIFNNQIRGSSGLMKKFGFDVTQVKRQFAMQALGIMFFGMMIQKAFQRLATSTVGDFMKITQGMTESGQAVNTLTVYMDLLKFSVGQAIAGALEALLPVIIPIIMAITDWVQQHEKLVGTLVAVGIGVGGVLFLFGQFWLGLKSVGQAIDAIFGVNLGAKVSAAGGLFSWLVNPITLVVVAALLLGWSMDKLAKSVAPKTYAEHTTVAHKAIQESLSHLSDAFANLTTKVFNLGQSINKNSDETITSAANWIYLKDVFFVIIDAIIEVIRLFVDLGSAIVSATRIMFGYFKAAQQAGSMDFSGASETLQQITKDSVDAADAVKDIGKIFSEVGDETTFRGKLYANLDRGPAGIYNEIIAEQQRQKFISANPTLDISQMTGATIKEFEEYRQLMIETGQYIPQNTQDTMDYTDAITDNTGQISEVVQAQQQFNSALGVSSESVTSAKRAAEEYNTQISALDTSLQGLIANLPMIDDLKGTIFDSEVSREAAKNIGNITSALTGGETPVTGTPNTNTGVTKQAQSISGLSSSIQQIITIVSGTKNSLIGAFNSFYDTLVKQQDYIENTLLGLYVSLYSALEDNAAAAVAAADAHERYNRALQGATGP